MCSIASVGWPERLSGNVFGEDSAMTQTDEGGATLTTSILPLPARGGRTR
jgi:hypothetical protein